MLFSEMLSHFMVWAQNTVTAWGYLGIFLVNLIGSASIVFPVPAFLVVFAMGSILNPWLVGLAAAIGAALGELTGYVLGLGGREAIKRKANSKWLNKAERWMVSHGVFPIIVIFAVSPLPDDITGIIGGVIKYDIKKFLLASFIGKLIMNMAIAWGGFFGLNWVLQVFGGVGW